MLLLGCFSKIRDQQGLQNPLPCKTGGGMSCSLDCSQPADDLTAAQKDALSCFDVMLRCRHALS